MIKFILFLLSMHAAKNVQAANIDDSVTIGTQTNIDRSVVIKSKSQIGNFVKIGGSTLIGANCRVGDHVEIARHCKIANDVVISKNVSIESGTTIENGSVIGEFVKTGSNVKIGNQVKVNGKASIGNGVEIRDDSLIDAYSKINDNAKVAPKVYIGKSAIVPANGIVNEYAIIHGGTKIPSGYTVKNNEIVFSSPSPFRLHKECASIRSISKDQLQIASNNSSAPSKAFNDMLRGLLDVQINEVKQKCEHGNTITTPNMSIVKTLFLIQRYGLERFTETYKKVRELVISWSADSNGTIEINGYRIPAAFHFGEKEDNDILEPDVKKKFIQLLKIEEDSKRVNRVQNDIFCSVTAQILNGKRDIIVIDPYHRNFANNNCVNIILISAMLLINVYSLFC